MYRRCVVLGRIVVRDKGGAEDGAGGVCESVDWEEGAVGGAGGLDMRRGSGGIVGCGVELAGRRGEPYK